MLDLENVGRPDPALSAVSGIRKISPQRCKQEAMWPPCLIVTSSTNKFVVDMVLVNQKLPEY